MNLTILLPLVLALQGALSHDDAGTIERGRKLFLSNCSRCHGAEATGNGPDAAFLAESPADLRRSQVLSTYPDEVLTKRILGGRMRLLEMRPQTFAHRVAETEVLYDYIASLPAVRWKAVDAGEEAYYERCSPCHGWYGHPDRRLPEGLQKEPTDLADPEFQSRVSDRELRVLIRHGKRDMPALTPQVTEKQTKDLVAFVRLLSPGHEMYLRFCGNCHGDHGEGAMEAPMEMQAPRFAFDRRYFRTHDGEQVRQAVWHMLDEKLPSMPHFEGSLTAGAVEAILVYLRSLPPLPSDAVEAPIR